MVFYMSHGVIHRVKQSHERINCELQSLTWELSPHSALSLHPVLNMLGMNMSQLAIVMEMYIDFLDNSNNQSQ